MATLDSTWDLRSTSCPRSLVVYLAPAIPVPSVSTAESQRTVGGTTNPFDHTEGINDAGSNSSVKTGGNPFDLASNPSGGGLSLRNHRNPDSSHTGGYCVVFGTECQSLHYRTYPSLSSLRQRRSGYSSSNHVAIPPLGMNENKQVSNGSEFVHSLHQPIDYNFESTEGRSSYTPSSSIVACIRASPTNQAGLSTANNSTYHNLFLLLRDDHSGTENPANTVSQGAYNASLVALNHVTSSISTIMSNLPRMSCATYHSKCGFVYAAGKSIMSLPAGTVRNVALSLSQTATTPSLPSIYFDAKDILKHNVRSSGTNGENTMALVCGGYVAVVPTNNNSFYAISGTNTHDGSWWNRKKKIRSEITHDGTKNINEANHRVEKILSFQQSSQVHPSIVVEIPTSAVARKSITKYDSRETKKSTNILGDESDTSLLFIASGRECAVVEITCNPRQYPNFISSIHTSRNNQTSNHNNNIIGPITCELPRHGITLLSSPILAAVGLSQSSDVSNGQDIVPTGPLVVVLTSDGLVHTRSPSCIGVPLSTIEVGTRPNDYFCLRSLPDRQIVAGSYSGEGRLISFHPDTLQDLADRLMKLSIDAFGTNFPRVELAEALMHSVSFSATSYVGPEPTGRAKELLKQYLEIILGLDVTENFDDGDVSSWFLETSYCEEKSRESRSTVSDQTIFHSPIASTYLCATALLCLLCTQLSPPNASLSCRVTKTCAMKIGTVADIKHGGISNSTVKVCEIIADKLLNESTKTASTSQSSHLRNNKGGLTMEFVEAAVWLLRCASQHEKSFQLLEKHMNNPSVRNNNRSVGLEDLVSVGNGIIEVDNVNGKLETSGRGGWSQIKYDSFTAAHLSELWSGDDACRNLVLRLTATTELLQRNPRLGISIFTASHPKNNIEWEQMNVKDDPLKDMHSMKVVKLLKKCSPRLDCADLLKHEAILSSPVRDQAKVDVIGNIPVEMSGRALVVHYLESAIGISTGRSIRQVHQYDSSDNTVEEFVKDLYDELAYTLLEGVISERSDNDECDTDSHIGSLYRSKLRGLLGWPSSHLRSERLMASLPASFKREIALCLGKLGRHKDAIRILYSDLKSLDMALKYCDTQFEYQKSLSLQEKNDFADDSNSRNNECAYLPLVSVALESDNDSERGIAAVLSVLSQRKELIDRAAVLRLLPENISVSQLAKGFLIPALIDNESQIRRLSIMTSLLRAKYLRLKDSLTYAQIKSQSVICGVPQLRELNLGYLIYSSKSFKARLSNASKLSSLPNVVITKHFFARYVIIQATITNVYDQTLAEASLIVAESSDEALLPSYNVPIKILPPNTTGSSWYVLAASPQRLDLSAVLACEVRYTILAVDSATGAPLGFSSGFSSGVSGDSFVEEIQDITIRHAEFEG